MLNMMKKISFKWCVVNSRTGSVKISGSETPSGTEYIVTNSGCPVRSDDLDYVLNKEIDFCCPHNGKKIKPVKKGLPPAGTKMPVEFLEEIKVPVIVKPEPEPEPEIGITEPETNYVYETPVEEDEIFTRRKRNKQD